jgi:hypothetical protein
VWTVFFNAVWIGAFTFKFVRPIFALHQNFLSAPEGSLSANPTSRLFYAALRNFIGSAVMLLSTVILAVSGVLYLAAVRVETAEAFLLLSSLDCILNVLSVTSIASFTLTHRQDELSASAWSIGASESLLELGTSKVSSSHCESGTYGAPSSDNFGLVEVEEEPHPFAMATFLRQMRGELPPQPSNRRQKDIGVSSDIDYAIQGGRNYWSSAGKYPDG